MSEEDTRKIEIAIDTNSNPLAVLENHINEFSEYKKEATNYYKSGYKMMEKVDALHSAHMQTAKFLSNLEALPIIAEKIQSIKNDVLPAAIAQSHVPVTTMNEALTTQAKTYLFVIKCLLWMIAALFGAFVTIKIWYPEFFK